MSDVNSVKIVGIKKSPNSKVQGTFYYNYYYVGSYNAYDLEHAEVYGSPAGYEFATVDIGCKVGDIVEFKYVKGFQDKAQLVGCTILQSAAPAKAQDKN